MAKLRRFRSVLVFLLALVAFDLYLYATQSTWESYSPDDYTEKVVGCAERPRDGVFVGGSPVSEGIDPLLLGAIPWRGITLNDIYCVGLSGGTTSDVYFGTIHACPVRPKVLVYGITASDMNDSRHEPHGAHSLMTWADVQDWRATRPDAAEWVTRHYLRGQLEDVWAAYRFRHGIRMGTAIQMNALFPRCCPETVAEANRQIEIGENIRRQNGYAPTQWFAHRRYDHMKASGWEQPPFEYLARYRTGSHLKYLHRLLDWARVHGTDVVLIDMPTTADLEQRHPAEFAEFRQRLAEVEQDRRVTVLRATREAVGLDNSHFADLIHLNRAGCIRLTAWVKGELERLGRDCSLFPEREGGWGRRSSKPHPGLASFAGGTQ
jgi:hypothetical protein